MIVTKKSSISGKIHSMDLDITDEQISEYNKGDKLIQDVFPNLSPDEREFIMSGITPEEWDSMFGE